MRSEEARSTLGYQRFASWAQRFHFTRKLGYLLSTLALILGTLTYLALTREAALGVTSQDVVLLLNLDLGVLLLLGILVSKRFAEVWAERKQGLAGSRLHVRLVLLLSVLTVTPTIVMVILSGLFLNAGVQSWFSNRVQIALKQSSAVAEAYLEEHKEVIRANVEALRRDLSEHLTPLIKNREVFDDFINQQADFRNLSEAIVFSTTPEVLARSRLTFALEFEFVHGDDLKKAAHEVVVLTSDQRDRVRALVKIDPDLDIYLLVGRIVDPKVLKRIDDTENALSDYSQLEHNLSSIKLKFTLIFSIIALLLLIIAIWFGLSYATSLSLPISRLLDATEKVTQGDLSTRVQIDEEKSDLGILARAFNRMTKWLEKQQKDLLQANNEADSRRRFIEAVLAGVSAGVIGLDRYKKIEVTNQSACTLLNTDFNQKVGELLTDVVPEMQDIFQESDKNFTQRQLNIKRRGYNRTFLVQLVKEYTPESLEEKAFSSHSFAKEFGYIVTFDDITELIRAQRAAAWSDVARRIAHEIKNPLTPIQLSAERLKRKYIKQITEDSGAFEKCIETISRQVEHIGRMVGEFSSFARMPQAIMGDIDIVALGQAVLTLESTAHPTIEWIFHYPQETFKMLGDATQLEQVFLNLLQNAADSVEIRLKEAPLPPGKIILTISKEHDRIKISVSDNGLGLPVEGREHLLEPYVTHKEKGTGLGLAIVDRIVEDHSGKLRLEDNPEGLGALIVIEFFTVRKDKETLKS